MGIWNELMYLVMMLFALTSNLSIAATSVCIVLGAILVIAQRICTGNLPDMDKGLVKMVGIYCVLQIVAALMAPDIPKSLEEVWGTVYRISPLFMGLGYLQTRRRMAWIWWPLLYPFLWGMLWVPISLLLGMIFLLLGLAINRPFMPPIF